MHSTSLVTISTALLTGTSAAMTLSPRASTVTVLGNVQFATPFCGDASEKPISTSDCTSALAQLFAANCANGLCSVPAVDGPGAESLLTATVGACEVFIGIFVGGGPATFEQASVQAEFPAFIDECVSPAAGMNNGNAIVRSTDGRMTLLFSDGVNTPGPE
ncbi:hypothetical protein QBC34DRAFT_461864 [Podospora aff. communis PSN243]|uniref:Uncharacterized protein n=1 Tax=Podospora aff. communis PSN243 TaxID=3040156 RepID=A0AAV9GQ33_9PEZI|nr:hypothetical protein QBC34DRAFT_461864 [Podospora aff. communis PSN243]